MKIGPGNKIRTIFKLKSPWKGPYIITPLVKTPVLYKVKEKTREYWIYHDRVKLCNDRKLLVWVKRLRNNILEKILKWITTLNLREMLWI